MLLNKYVVCAAYRRMVLHKQLIYFLFRRKDSTNFAHLQTKMNIVLSIHLLSIYPTYPRQVDIRWMQGG